MFNKNNHTVDTILHLVTQLYTYSITFQTRESLSLQDAEDEDTQRQTYWTPDSRCSKKKKPPSQPPLNVFILYGSKGTLIDNCVALSPLSDPLSVFADNRDMRWKLLTQTSD